jgi:hypothetical protein
MCHGDLRQALHHFYDNTNMWYYQQI